MLQLCEASEPSAPVTDAAGARRRQQSVRARAQRFDLEAIRLRGRARPPRRASAGPLRALSTASSSGRRDPSAGPATVLVVDDDEAVRESIAALLAVSGYRILEAADGEEALDVVHREPVDVMILDLWMPRRNGLAVLEGLPLRSPAVIVHTAAQDVTAEIPPDLLQAKVFLSLRKPASPGILISAVAEAVNHPPADWSPGHPEHAAGGPVGVPGPHVVTRTVIRSGNRWFAHLACECGWSQTVGPIADEQRLEWAMTAAQLEHQAP